MNLSDIAKLDVKELGKFISEAFSSVWKRLILKGTVLLIAAFVIGSFLPFLLYKGYLYLRPKIAPSPPPSLIKPNTTLQQELLEYLNSKREREIPSEERDPFSYYSPEASE